MEQCQFHGKTIIDTDFDEIESRGIYIYAKSQSQNKVYDTQGNVLNINFNRSIYETNNEKYRISTLLNNNITYYGIIDKEGNQLVEEIYRYIEYLYNNYFIALDETGNLGVIDNNGRIVLGLKYNSMQKIKGKNIVQAIQTQTNMTEIYSSEMKNIINMKDALIQTQEDYIIVSNGVETTYLDNNGNVITDLSNLKNTDFPEKIGGYRKEQASLELIYYVR